MAAKPPVRVSWWHAHIDGPDANTVHGALWRRLGREPTGEECVAEVRRIFREAAESRKG